MSYHHAPLKNIGTDNRYTLSYRYKTGTDGGKVVIFPGVSIGNNVTVGAASVMTKNLPDNVVAFGKPCKIVREDKSDYFSSFNGTNKFFGYFFTACTALLFGTGKLYKVCF